MPERPDPEFWSSPRAHSRDAVARPGSYSGSGSYSDSSSYLGRLRENWDSWRSNARFGLVVLVAVAVAAGFIWNRVGSSGGDTTAPPSRSTSFRASNSVATTSTTSAKRVVVHVAGLVARPGVVELAPGARVIDALEAAGGGLADADLDRLNLAALLIDGQQVLVARVGDPLRPAATGAGTGTTGTGDTGVPTGPLNLNTASATEIETLPGIGPVLAAAIIREREKRGGFSSVNELREVDGIGEKRFSDLRDLVTV